MPSVAFPCKIFTIDHPIKNIANIPKIANNVQKIKLKNLSIAPPKFNKNFMEEWALKPTLSIFCYYVTASKKTHCYHNNPYC